ncbi:MAG TPA: beta-N-acetylhexosaminidase [Anaerolineales bacterium]|nr:beta-N-acetylhexosaminidase [Anaerolineales bacterium]
MTLIPMPASIRISTGGFTITDQTTIIIQNSEPEMFALGNLLREYIEQHTGLKLEVTTEGQEPGSIQLQLNENMTMDAEGYRLVIATDSVHLDANYPAGLFYGLQTLRQLLSMHPARSAPFHLPAASIQDSPRYRWRGAMLDVARHFFRVEDVKRFVDLISHYKLNRLHLHLTDDQGWRIEIKSWPKLTEIGGRTQVNGGGGGFYTQEQYREIVDYARSRYVMIVPEIDTPGHTNAALASYPELNVSEEATDLYEGTTVGFSSLSINMEITYRLLDDVVRELAALTPGPYIHIGGDEARSTPEPEYRQFIKRCQQIVFAHHKIPIGWSEIGDAELDSRTIAQAWVGAGYQGAKEQGCKVILSPANKTYLDMKYDASTPIGLDWAGLISVKDSYDWEPGSYIEKLEESEILGLEAPLWTETVVTMKDIEFMAFPRLAGLAELAWSPKDRSWEEYKGRLAKHGKHMEALGISFFKSPDVEWE